MKSPQIKQKRNKKSNKIIKLQGIALMWTTYGKVYNGITDDDTHDDILNLSVVYFL